MTSKDMKISVRVSGGVQGVGFRVWVRMQAIRMGLRGWVRNEVDGSVTALLAGPDQVVRDMLEQLHKGPMGASVADVTWQEAPAATVLPNGFTIDA